MIVVVFDVESLGLHGEGFAAGAVVVDTETGETLDELYAACKPSLDGVSAETAHWLTMNVIHHLKYPHISPRGVRERFWRFWRKWADKGALLCADCAWPVEANFLRTCVWDNRPEREWKGPYPLLDLSTLLWAQGINPTGTFERLESELPAHDPLKDARQSARLLLEALARQKAVV